METTIGRESIEISREIQRRVNGGYDQVETSGKLFKSPVLFAVVHVMSAQVSGLGLFTVTGREGMHFTAPFAGKLQRHMSQSPHANNPHTRGGGHVMDLQRGKNSRAATKERTCLLHIQCIRQR